MSAYDIELAVKSRIPKELLNEASSLHLAMHVSSDAVQATLADVAIGMERWSCSFYLERKSDLKESVRLIEDRNWSERVFRKCTLTFNCKNFTLVPAAFYNETMMGDLLRFNTTETQEFIEQLYLPMAEAHIVYGIPEALVALSARFPNIRIMPSVYPLTLSVEREVTRKNIYITVFIECDYMALIVFKEGQLQLLNYFEIAGHEDVLYYITSVFMRLKLDQESAQISLMDDGRHTQLHKTLAVYYPDIHYVSDHLSANRSTEVALNYVPYQQIQCV